METLSASQKDWSENLKIRVHRKAPPPNAHMQRIMCLSICAKACSRQRLVHHEPARVGCDLR